MVAVDKLPVKLTRLAFLFMKSVSEFSCCYDRPAFLVSAGLDTVPKLGCVDAFKEEAFGANAVLLVNCWLVGGEEKNPGCC